MSIFIFPDTFWLSKLGTDALPPSVPNFESHFFPQTIVGKILDCRPFLSWDSKNLWRDSKNRNLRLDRETTKFDGVFSRIDGCLVGEGQRGWIWDRDTFSRCVRTALSPLRYEAVTSNAMLFFEKDYRIIRSTNWSVFSTFFQNLVGVFLVPVPARTGAHARHVSAFVVSRFSAGNYLTNNWLFPDNIEETNHFRSRKTHQVQ